MASSAEPNAEQIRYWNEVAGPKWVTLQDAIDRQIRPLGVRTMERAELGSGDRVIDVGCGCGRTTLEIARRVRPGGSVLGVDVSQPMLDCARRAASGIGDVAFENADAQLHRFSEGAFDVVYSRFGVMFFADPAAAFANLRRALVVGGRLAFLCWQEISRNPWVLVPLETVAQLLPLPPPPAPDAPGPFSLADPARIRGVLAEAGFRDVLLEEVRETLSVGGGVRLDDAVDFLLQIGPASAALREADPALRPRVTEALRAALAPYDSAEGARMGSAAWIVTARNPG